MTIDYDDLCEYVEFDGRRWKWPKQDTKLKAVNDWVNDLNAVLLLMTKAEHEMQVAVQAGGAMGVWPVALAEHFDLVFTYEPDKLNYWCLAANVSHLPEQIMPMNAALGEQPGSVVTALHPTERGNSGAFFTIPANPARDNANEAVPVIVLDKLKMVACDLICLDIEGREVEALRGAYDTIEKFRPFIMIEEKPLPQMGPGKQVNHTAGEATEWLERIHKYTVVQKVHRDVILAPPQ
jgi:FkbM family methyltransferase